MNPEDADGMENSVDSDQIAPLGAVWSGSAPFAQTYLSQYIEFLLYVSNCSSNQLHQVSQNYITGRAAMTEQVLIRLLL